MNGSSFEQAWIPFTQECCVAGLVEIGPMVLEQKIFKISSSMYIWYFIIISPWKRAGSFIWTNLNPLHPRILCAKFEQNWPSGSWGEDFQISSMYFCYYVIISPWKRAAPFIWLNLSHHHPRMLCSKVGWNWPIGSWEEDENVKSLQQRQQWQQTNFDQKAHLSIRLMQVS